MQYWNESYETMDRMELEKIQSERLLRTIERVYHNVPYYRNQMQKLNLMPEDIKGIEDLNKLPFTTKDDLRENYPYGFVEISKNYKSSPFISRRDLNRFKFLKASDSHQLSSIDKTDTFLECQDLSAKGIIDALKENRIKC